MVSDVGTRETIGTLKPDFSKVVPRDAKYRTEDEAQRDGIKRFFLQIGVGMFGGIAYVEEDQMLKRIHRTGLAEPETAQATLRGMLIGRVEGEAPHYDGGFLNHYIVEETRTTNNEKSLIKVSRFLWDPYAF